MTRRDRATLHPLVASACTLMAVCLAALAACGCGSGKAAPAGLVIAGPGLQTTQPPWKPEYAHLRERLAALKLPSVGNEKFHIHAALHIYDHGLLVPVPADVGLELSKHIETSLHTHDGTGIVHMETTRPYNFTLGDFFAVWGVKLGPEQVGGLKGYGGDKLHFYVNGRPLTDPAAYVLHRADSIVIGYGPSDSFPHTPSTVLLKEVEEGKAGLNCSATTTSKKAKSCITGGSSGSTGQGKSKKK